MSIEVEVDLETVRTTKEGVRKKIERKEYREFVGLDSIWLRLTSYFQKYPKML
jgi:hypothetical protein